MVSLGLATRLSGQTKGRCSAQRPKVWHILQVLAADQINIATAKADIVKFTICQTIQRLARDTGRIPSLHGLYDSAHRLNETVQANSAKRRN
jgi:hypothetical protein